MISVNKILCPTDFSEPSYVALEAANGIALQYSSELYLLHVIPPIPVYISKYIQMARHFDLDSYEKELSSSSEQSLREVIEKRVSKEVKARPIVELGDPHEEIVKVADEGDMDLIVIATHGLTGWRHFVFGSVAEKVIRLSPCPVLVIRAPKEEGRDDGLETVELQARQRV